MFFLQTAQSSLVSHFRISILCSCTHSNAIERHVNRWIGSGVFVEWNLVSKHPSLPLPTHHSHTRPLQQQSVCTADVSVHCRCQCAIQISVWATAKCLTPTPARALYVSVLMVFCWGGVAKVGVVAFPLLDSGRGMGGGREGGRGLGGRGICKLAVLSWAGVTWHLCAGLKCTWNKSCDRWMMKT